MTNHHFFMSHLKKYLLTLFFIVIPSGYVNASEAPSKSLEILFSNNVIGEIESCG